jgi:hypothetical protein
MCGDTTNCVTISSKNENKIAVVVFADDYNIQMFFQPLLPTL